MQTGDAWIAATRLRLCANPGEPPPPPAPPSFEGGVILINGVQQAEDHAMALPRGGGSPWWCGLAFKHWTDRRPEGIQPGSLVTHEALAHLHQETNLEWSYYLPDLFRRSHTGHSDSDQIRC